MPFTNCMSCMALKFVDTVQKLASKTQLLYWTKVDIQGWDNRAINYGSYEAHVAPSPPLFI